MKLFENVVDKGIVGFPLFLFFWFLGCIFGCCVMLLGLRDELNRLLNGGGEQDEIDKMIENMNKMGPNN